MTIYDRERRRGTQDQTQQQASRARRYALYAQVKALQAQGRAILQIARELNISRQTVRKYMASEHFPEYPHPKRQKSMLDPYVPYLQQRWDAGCHNTQQLWRELQSQGFAGLLPFSVAVDGPAPNTPSGSTRSPTGPTRRGVYAAHAPPHSGVLACLPSAGVVLAVAFR